MLRRTVTMAATTAALLVLSAPPALSAGSAPPRQFFSGCPATILYGARGSGEALDDGQLGLGAAGRALYDNLASRVGAANVGVIADGYTAVPVLTVKMFGRRYYNESMRTGAQSAYNDIHRLARDCPSSKLVITGYSQGAHAIRYALFALRAEAQVKIRAVVLFGDPFFASDEPNVVPMGNFRHPRKGLLHKAFTRYGVVIKRFGNRYANRVASFCHHVDPVCQSAFRRVDPFGSHVNYHVDAVAAADFVAARLR